jgi:predicted ferric reductase
MAMMFATFFSGLPYARWKQLHAASGVAYLAALAHVAGLLPAPGEGRSGAILLLAAMAAGVAALALRHGLDRRSLSARRYRVEKVTRVSPTTVEVTLAPLRPRAPLTYAPGQFVFVAFDIGPGYAGCSEYHPFTISSPPGAPNFRVLVKALGDCTARMQRLVTGVVARVQGPHGALFRGADFTRAQLWLGGGIGITPFLAMAPVLPAAAAGVDLYYLARNAGESFGLDTLRDAAARNPRLRVFALLANEDAQAVRAAAEASSAPLAAREVYLCGPPGMLQASLGWLADAGVPESQIHAERFDFR